MFLLTIAAVDKQLFRGEVDSVNVPGSEGQMTLLSNHSPLITLLKEGKVVVRMEDDKKEFPIMGGLLEVSKNEAVILV